VHVNKFERIVLWRMRTIYGVVFEQNGDRDCSLLRHMNEQNQMKEREGESLSLSLISCEAFIVS